MTPPEPMPEIDVTEADIAEAKRLIAEGLTKRSKCCPIALAASRAFGRPLAATWQCICQHYTAGPPKEFVIDLPPEASRFVLDFDSGRPVAPFSFTPLATQKEKQS